MSLLIAGLSLPFLIPGKTVTLAFAKGRMHSAGHMAVRRVFKVVAMVQ